MVLVRMIVLVAMAGLPNLAATLSFPFRGVEAPGPAMSSELMRKAALSDSIAQSAAEHTKLPRDAVHRCHQPVPEFGTAPSVEDCSGAIKQLQKVQGDITVKLVEGCYHAGSGNCTASVCPQQVGTSTISPMLAAQHMADFVLTECIANGLRGWYMDRDYGVGVYLT